MNEDLLTYDLELPPLRRIGHILRHSAEQVKAGQKAIEAIRALRPTFDGASPEDVYTFPAVISSKRLDSHFTRMAESSLKNYADDARTGVAFMNSHKHGELAMGYSYDGRLEGDGNTAPEADTPQVLADFYLIRGLNLNGLPTDEMIKGIQTDMIRDVSIGFCGGDYICSICGQDLFDFECRHYPGMEFEVVDNPQADPEDQTTTTRTCFAWIENANLSEVSAVFDGSNPDAMILKAQQRMRAGKMDSKTLLFLEKRYRINIKEPIRIVNQLDKENDMNGDGNTKSGAPDNKLNEASVEARYAAKAVGLVIDEKDDVLSIVRKMGAEIERLQPLAVDADQGRELRKALIDEAVKEAVRANGKDAGFSEENTRKLLESLDVVTIRELKSSWTKIGDAAFKGGKRVTQDNPDEANGGDKGDSDSAGDDAGDKGGSSTADDADEDDFDLPVGSSI